MADEVVASVVISADLLAALEEWAGSREAFRALLAADMARRLDAWMRDDSHRLEREFIEGNGDESEPRGIFNP